MSLSAGGAVPSLDRGLETESWKNNTKVRSGGLSADKQGQISNRRVNVRPFTGDKSDGQRQM